MSCQLDRVCSLCGTKLILDGMKGHRLSDQLTSLLS